MRGLIIGTAVVLCALAVGVFTGTVATATTYTWIGGDGSSQDWSDPTNWDGVGVPVGASTADIVFSSGSSNNGTAAVPLNQNIATSLTVNSLTFDNTSGVGVAYYLGGSQLRFEADGGTQPSIVSTNWQSRYFANDIELAAGATLDLQNAGYTFYFDGPISGDGALLMTGQTGGGQVYLNAANSYKGGTTYKGTGNSGQGYVALRVSVDGAIGTGLVTLDGGNLKPYNATTNSRPGGLIFTGTGTTYANDFSLESDSPVFVAMTSMGGSAASSADLSGDFDLNGNALYLRGIGTGTIAGDISSTGGGGSLVKIDSGTWVLSGNNTYEGTTTISDGVLSIGAAANLGPGDIVLDGGTIRTTGAANITLYNNITLTADGVIDTQAANNTYLRGVIDDGANTFGITKTGSKHLHLYGNNTYDGDSLLSGVVYIAHNNALGSTVGGTTINGTLTLTTNGMVVNEDLNIAGTLRMYPGSGGCTYAGDITLIGNTTISAKYAGTIYDITGDVSGDYGLTIHSEPGMTRLSGTNTYTGTTTVRRSTLLIGSDAPDGAAGALGNATSAVQMGRSGTNLDVALLTDGAFTVSRDIVVNSYNPAGTTTIGGNQTAGASTFSGHITLERDVILTSANTDANAVTFSGVIDDGTETFGVTKKGPGTVVLSGANTYDGATSVEAGILKLGSSDALVNSSGVTVASGATVDVNGFNAANNFTIAGTGSSGQGALINSGAGIQGNVGVTLAANATIGVTGGRFDIGIGRLLDGGGFTLTKIGAGTLPVRRAANNFAGIKVDEGLVYFEATQAGMVGTTLKVASGATVAIYTSSSDRSANAQVELNGGSLTQMGRSDGYTGTWSGDFEVKSTSNLKASGDNLALTGSISGAGGLNITGPHTVTLSGTNSYDGATTVTSGILKIGSAEALGDNLNVTVASGATFDFNGFKPNKNFTIAGTGTSGQGALYSDGYLIGNVGVTLSADATIGVTANRLDIGHGRPLDGGGFTLTKIGAGSLPIRGAANNFAGINVDEGLVYFEAVQAGMAGTTLKVASGATLAIYTSSTDRSVNAMVELNGGSLTQLGTHSGTTGTWTGDFTVNSASSIKVSGNNMAINGTISGGGDLNITGPYTVTFSGANDYTGATTVTSGTLAVDGSIASSSGLSLLAAGTLEGHGTVPEISGAGLVSPGNSPGILTAASVDPTGGLDFALEFTADSPDYTVATASRNDVLRLTDAVPFAAALDGSNTVGVYFDATEIEEDDIFLGGFYTDQNADFTDLIAGASFAYYITGDGGGTHDLNGQLYYTLAEYSTCMGFDVATVYQEANFGGGVVNGHVMQLTATIPEPTSCLLLLLGLVGLLFVRRR